MTLTKPFMIYAETAQGQCFSWDGTKFADHLSLAKTYETRSEAALDLPAAQALIPTAHIHQIF